MRECLSRGGKITLWKTEHITFNTFSPVNSIMHWCVGTSAIQTLLEGMSRVAGGSLGGSWFQEELVMRWTKVVGMGTKMWVMDLRNPMRAESVGLRQWGWVMGKSQGRTMGRRRYNAGAGEVCSRSRWCFVCNMLTLESTRREVWWVSWDV